MSVGLLRSVSVGPLGSPDGNYGNDMVDGEVHMVKDQVTSLPTSHQGGQRHGRGSESVAVLILVQVEVVG